MGVKQIRTILFVLPVVLLLALTSGCRTIRPPADVKPIERAMLATAYCSCSSCCEWKRDWLLRPVAATGPNAGKPKVVGRTASGVPARNGTIAADGALYPFGTVMYIPGYGYGRVEDRGRSIKGNHIDLYFVFHRSAIQWGVRKNTKVKIWFPPGSLPPAFVSEKESPAKTAPSR